MISKKGKKAQAGPIGAIIMFIVFLIMWFVFLGRWIADVGQDTITANHLVGIEAFFYANLNFVIWIFMILGMMGWMYFSAEG